MRDLNIFQLNCQLERGFAAHISAKYVCVVGKQQVDDCKILSSRCNVKGCHLLFVEIMNIEGILLKHPIYLVDDSLLDIMNESVGSLLLVGLSLRHSVIDQVLQRNLQLARLA